MRLPLPYLRLALAVAAIVTVAALVVWTSVVAQREVDDLGAVNSDNLQWSLAQIDVEFLRYRLALEQAQEGTGDDPAALEQVRRRFDVFYGRIDTLQGGQVYRRLHASTEYQADRRAVKAYLDATVPLIDGPDAELRAALPEMAAEAQTRADEVRALSLSGLTAYAEVSDARRVEVMQTLSRMAILLLVLFAGLLLLAVWLLRLNGLSTRRARELEQTGMRMRTIVQTSIDPIIVSNDEGTILDLNRAATEVFGYSVDEAQGQTAMQLLFPDEDPDATRAEVMSFIEGRRRPEPGERQFELTGRDRSGRSFPVEVSIDRAIGPDGPIFVSFLRDISTRKAAEEALRDARDRALAGEKAKAEFLAVMSHEMRTPLNGLLGTIQILRDTDLDDRQAAMLDITRTSGELLLGLVNDVLDLSKYEAGKLTREDRVFDLGELLDGVVEATASLAAGNGNTLGWTWTGPAQGAVRGDPRRLRQVLLNLVGNALKFTHGGMVEIEVERLGDGRVELRVIDSGIGISESDLTRVFNDFETLDSSYARQADGTGLGLGIARRLVEVMGGEIGAESELGEGSLFWVRLPLDPAAPLQAPAPASVSASAPASAPGSVSASTAAPLSDAAPASGSIASMGRSAGPGDTAPPVAVPGASSGGAAPLRILLVEDNEINRFVAREMLQREGHSVTEAVNGSAGVDRAESDAFDVILMDISMPVMDGQEATRRIRAGSGPCARVPIIAVTAHALPEEIARFREAGMTDCIAKPIDRSALQALLRRVGIGAGDAGAVPSSAGTRDLQPLVSPAHLDELRAALAPEEVAQLRDRFVAECDEQIARLGRLQGPQEVAQLAHKCAGSCATFGLLRLHAALGRIEKAGKAGQVDAAGIAAAADFWRDSRTALLATLDAPASAGN
ncbi:PAS domain-containing hybrid sensor histidine kinase/response regulator [Mesobaculum littorinae]|uniref:histidine kinase n=1 Tax=Mesobaculum littorinae TaxID=2486419 RepID=A0A438ADM5_9RHOB|nr:PAS domain-containing hybrid sensor histidine kinase/response regulator [Mesobaculum littorinae]RVV96775.1 PAS domain-containing hybrid sensor histidine kinase/response regulator [Mesobaculum littorinae]